MAEKSNYPSSIISLPKGGGAMHGLGEKFSPDLFTGTGNFSVPVALPPGRNGFQPQLNLGYSTGQGNGIFLLEWGLSFPGVVRQTAKGIQLPAFVQWFNHKGLHFDLNTPFSMVDFYLSMLAKKCMSIKLREGDVEIKQLIRNFGKLNFLLGSIASKVVQWMKWSFDLKTKTYYLTPWNMAHAHALPRVELLSEDSMSYPGFLEKYGK